MASSSSTIQKGDIVSICGLQNKSGFNNKIGTALGYGYGEQKDRHRVKLVQGANVKSILVKKHNLNMLWPLAFTVKQQKCIINGFCCAFCKTLLSDCDENIISCDDCMAVYYCSIKCKKQHQHNKAKCVVQTSCHLMMCKPLKVMLRNGYRMLIHRLGAMHFDIFQSAAKDIKKMMNQQKYTKWCEDMKGDVNGVPLNLLLMQFDMDQNPRVISSWKEWYDFHRTPLDHTISMCHHNVMTVYWILIQNGVTPRAKRHFILHLVGVDEHEMDDLMYWVELGTLLPRCTFSIIFFGPDIPSQWASLDFECGRMQLQCHRVKYEKKTIRKNVMKKYRKPDIVIGLNPGFGNYGGQWTPALKYILDLKVPAFFTEYTVASVLMSNAVGADWAGGEICEFQANPFMEPMVIAHAQQGLRTWSSGNNVIYTVRKKNQAPICSFKIKDPLLQFDI